MPTSASEIEALFLALPPEDQLRLAEGAIIRAYGLDLEDVRDLLDPKVRENIRVSWEERQAGEGRPADELLAELEAADAAEAAGRG